MSAFRGVDAERSLALYLIFAICDAASVEPYVGNVQIDDLQPTAGSVLRGVLVRLEIRNVTLK